jgi:hypothetical protein
MNTILSQPTLKTGGAIAPVLSAPVGRGFQAAPLHYAAAPQIDARGFISQAQGMGAIGGGLQDASSSLLQVQGAMSHAVNVRRVTEAGLSTAQASQDIAAEIAQEPDPTKWEGIASKRASEATKNLITPSDSPAARQQIELHAAEWGIRLAGQTKLSAIGRQFELTAQTLKVAHSQAIASKDYGAASGIEENMKPYLGPAAMEDARLQSVAAQMTDTDVQAKTLIEQEGAAAVPKVKALYDANPHFDKQTRESRMGGMEYQASIEDLAVMAESDPFRAAELMGTHNVRGPDQVRLVKQIESSIQQKRADSLKADAETINGGGRLTAEALINNPFYSDFDRKQLATFQDTGPKNDPVAYATLFADAANFKGDESSPEYAVLSQRASIALDGDLQSKVLGKLGETVKNKNPDELTRSMNEVFSLAKDDLSAGRFGELHGALGDLKTALPPKARMEVDAIKAELLTDAEKARLAAEPAYNDFLEGRARDVWYQRNNPKPADGENFRNHFVEDSNKATAAQRRYGDALSNLEAWKKANPKATPQELRAQYDKSTVGQRAALPSLFPDSAPHIDLGASLDKTRAILLSK